MKRFKAQHWIAIAAFLSAVGGQIGTHNDFRHLLTPGFVSFLLVQGGAFLLALFATPADTHPRIRTRSKYDPPDLAS